MKTLGLYTVTGTREYRGHQPGETFEASIPPGAERRAIDRGDIVFWRRVEATLQPGTYRIPDGWLAGRDSTQPEAPNGAPLS